MAKTMRGWALIWALGCLAAGVAMAFEDGSHLPRWAVPIVMAVAGAVGGLIAGLPFALLVRSFDGLAASRFTRLLVGAVCGLLAGAALYGFGIGIVLAYCLVAGAVLGLLSAAGG